MSKIAKRSAALLLAVILVLGVLVTGVSAADEVETDTHTVTFVYNMDGYQNATIEIGDGKRLASILSSAFSEYSSIVRGYTFDAWYLDPACTNACNRTAKVTGDMTLYAGWNPWSASEADMYNTWLDLVEQMRGIFSSRYAYESAGVDAIADKYFQEYTKIGSVTVENNKAIQRMIDELVQVKEIDDVRWYIWDDAMPSEDTSDINYFLTQDGESFRPSITACLLEDQSTVKGNIVICSGGGYLTRNDTTEAWPTVAHMSALGYNCFVVNYRCAPNATIDASIDLQRAIRYIKYHAEEKGIGAIENIATVGFSAGGLTVMGQLTKLYGNITPDSIYPDYVCDEIDKVNADYKVTAPIYGYYGDSWDSYTNEHIPAVFNAIGTADGLYPSYIVGAEKVAGMTENSVYYEYPDAGHGFGMGDKDAYAAMVSIHFDQFLTEYFDVDAAVVEHWSASVASATEAAKEALKSVGVVETPSETPSQPSEAPEYDFTVTWVDAVLGDEITGYATVSGEDWTLSYDSSFGVYLLGGIFYEENGVYGTELIEDGGLGMWASSAWSGIEPDFVEALAAYLSKTPAETPEYDFTVTWVDAVLGDEITGYATVSGEDWTLSYDSSFGAYLLGGIFYEENGVYGTELIEDGGLGMWASSAWSGIEPAFVEALAAYLGKAPAETPKYDFTVTWVDAVLGDEITGYATVSGEDWTLSYDSSFGAYLLGGIFYEENGVYGTELIEDGGLGMWASSAWSGIEPAFVEALAAYLGKAPAPVTPVQPEDPTVSGSTTHTVVKGDCLWNIALKYYGVGTQWKAIYEANRAIIRDPNLIYVGLVLEIPFAE